MRRPAPRTYLSFERIPRRAPAHPASAVSYDNGINSAQSGLGVRGAGQVWGSS